MKNPTETDILPRDIQKILEQNNFTNQNLKTLSDQLNRIETNLHETDQEESKISYNKPLFTPHEIPKKIHNQLKEKDFMKDIDDKILQLQNTLTFVVAPETPSPSSKIPKAIQTLSQLSETEVEEILETFTPQDQTLNMAKWNHNKHNTRQTKNYYPRPSFPDQQYEEFVEPAQYFKGTGIYKWNLDGLSEYQKINKLQEMTMVASAYKMKKQCSDKAVAEILVSGFSGRLKTWWDKYLTESERYQILNSIKTDEYNEPIKVEDDEELEDAVNTLIFSIVKYFIGNTSKIEERSSIILTNLKCPKIQDYNWYEETFLTKLGMRDDQRLPFWKEKFIDGLPRLFAEKVKTRLREHNEGIIPYEHLTFPDISDTIKDIAFETCTNFQLNQKLQRELVQSHKELGTFCEQFGLSNKNLPPSRKHKKHRKHSSTKQYYKRNRTRPSQENFYKKTYKNKPKTKQFESKKKPIKYKDNQKFPPTCYKCGKVGHYRNKCPLKNKINSLDIDEHLKKQLELLMLSNSESEQELSSSQEDLEIDNIISSDESNKSDTSSSDKTIKNNCHCNVITREQELIMEMIEDIEDPHLKKNYLLKLKENLQQQTKKNKPIENCYDLDSILKKAKQPSKTSKIPIDDIKFEIKDIRREIKNLKFELGISKTEIKELTNQLLILKQQDSKNIIQASTSETPGKEESENIFLLTQISYQKWNVRLKIVINKEYTINTTALFDSGADLNCIQEGLVPIKYFEPTRERLSSANGTPLRVKYKLTKAHVCNQNICIKTPFILVKDLNREVILGTPFLNIIQPMTVSPKGISTNIFDQEIIFEFLDPPNIKDLNILKNIAIDKAQINNISKIISKEKHLMLLKQEKICQQIKIQLQDGQLQLAIENFKNKIIKEVSSTIPNAFWNRKQHKVTLPYIKDFQESKIKTKARPIQMNQELLKYCKTEIQDLLNKKLIRPSKSPWSCAAFYVNKNAEIERGTPRLVINYKPLNDVLQWIRYPIPNKQDLLQRLVHAKIFSKFDLKSGFWQIQISEQDKYKTAFTVPFGQYEWNVMPFGLKNAPSEFQKIMNDIFNPYSEFSIVYIDDILIFSNSIQSHWKHLNTFLYVIKKNGLVLSPSKINLFQTRIRFLGHYIDQGTIKPIERALEFANKFPDEIKDKQQLQRFLGSLNYISDYYQKLSVIAAPLRERLKKNPPPWSSQHTQIIKQLKHHLKSLPCLHIADPQAYKIVETDASDLGYGGILKQRLPGHHQEQLVRFTSGTWTNAQRNYSTIKKEILSIVLCVQKFQSDLLNQEFLIRIDCKAAKHVLQKDVQNIASKQIFARWQAILSVFDYKIEYIKGESNSIPDFLTREFLQENHAS